MGKPRRGANRPPANPARARWRGLWISGAIGVALLLGIAIWVTLQEPTPASFAAERSGGPRLAVDKELIDFGPVSFDRMVKARFQVRNTGDQTLRLAVDPRVEAIEGC